MTPAPSITNLPEHTPGFAMEDSRALASTRRIRVAIVERDPLIRDSLRALVEQAPELSCVATHANVREALMAMPGLQPDVMLVDGQLLAQNNAGLISQMKASSSATQILILATFDLGWVSLESVCAGASGDVPKTTPAAELVQAVKWVHSGGSLMSMPLARKVRSHFRDHQALKGGLCPLTSREEQIVAAVARGDRYSVIADEFGVDVSAILELLRGVYAKLGDIPPVT